MMEPSHSAHTRSFAIGRQDLLFLCFTTLMFWIHHSRFTAVFTQKLLVPSTVFTVLDYIYAVTFWTMKDYRFYNHAPFIPSFRKSLYRILMFVIM